jgi:cobalt-zinc-cadmium efflux system protein
MLSGLIVYLSGWNYADAIVSILVSLWIAREAVVIVKKTVDVLMEGTPEGVEFGEVDGAMLALPGVKGVHDLHIWSISSSDLALSAHVVVETPPLQLGDISSLKDVLARDFSVGHVTIELENEGGQCAGSSCDIVPAGLKQNGPHVGHRH